MTHVMGTPESQTLASTASAWLVRMETGTVTPDERRRFEEWLSADPAHSAAYHEAVRFWRALDGLSQDEICELNRYLPDEAAAASPPAVPRWRPATAWAASIMLVAALGIWFAVAWLPVGDYRTAVGEQRTIALPDGSTVQLNTDTALSVMFTEEVRRLTLHRGEAFFTVAPDARRPFDVAADHGVVRALGTAFNIRTEHDRTMVTVAEHGVTVTLESEASMTVQAGEQILYHQSHWLGSVTRTDMTRSLAWLRHRLLFDNEPLPKVLEELARYRSGRLVFLRDSSLNDLLVTGSFDTERLDRFLPALEESLPIRVVTLTDRVLLLYRGRAKKL